MTPVAGEEGDTHTRTQTRAHACTPSGPDSLLMLLWPCSGGFHASSATLTPRTGPALESQNKNKRGGGWDCCGCLNSTRERREGLYRIDCALGNETEAKQPKNPTSPKF